MPLKSQKKKSHHRKRVNTKRRFIKRGGQPYSSPFGVKETTSLLGDENSGNQYQQQPQDYSRFKSVDDSGQYKSMMSTAMLVGGAAAVGLMIGGVFLLARH